MQHPSSHCFLQHAGQIKTAQYLVQNMFVICTKEYAKIHGILADNVFKIMIVQEDMLVNNFVSQKTQSKHPEIQPGHPGGLGKTLP